MIQQDENIVTVIGDSTLDNRIWVPNIYKNILIDYLGIKRDSRAEKLRKAETDFWKPDLSVVEHLMHLLPNYTVHDFSNDGFTTKDVLNGQNKNAVFSGIGVKLSMFPDVFFKPLVEGEESIKKSQSIILSIGGNNVREFLMQAFSISNPQARREYIKNNFHNKLEELQLEYIEIVERIRAMNPDAKIILMTQYYPSTKQNNYKIYPFMQEVGKALNLGINPNNPMDVIYEIIKATYFKAFSTIQDDNIVAVDVTSSLDPHNNKNHVSQIEPSAIGGQKIAQMLGYVLTQGNDARAIYQFLPEFFSEVGMTSKLVITTPIESWVPKHPNEFNKKANYDPQAAVDLLKAFEGEDRLTEEELDDIHQNVKLQQAIIVLMQVSPTLVTPDNFRKLVANDQLQSALSAAHGYLNSGRFGIFHTHGAQGKWETKKFVMHLMSFNEPSHVLIANEMHKWLKTSNLNNSSRAYYACDSGFFQNITKDKYINASRSERKVLLKAMMHEEGEGSEVMPLLP